MCQSDACDVGMRRLHNSYAEMKHSDWLEIVMGLAAAKQSALSYS